MSIYIGGLKENRQVEDARVELQVKGLGW